MTPFSAREELTTSQNLQHHDHDLPRPICFLAAREHVAWMGRAFGWSVMPTVGIAFRIYIDT